MAGFLQLGLVAILAAVLRRRYVLLDGLSGAPRYLAALGLTLFLVNAVDFGLYVVLGWGPAWMLVSWTLLVFATFWFWRAGEPAEGGTPWGGGWSRVRAVRRWNFWFLFFAVFVLARFVTGLYPDEEGHVWCNFNFVDTAFHLSVANAFLDAPRFPPTDLDLYPYPLKYHFLADFYVAQLGQMGLRPLRAIWTMNLLSAVVLVGTFWGVFERWLKLSARWVMLAGFVFFFLNTALVNWIHFLWFEPVYFDGTRPIQAILRFPYFNFESLLTNMFEPQRGLLFTMPVVLVVLHAIFGRDGGEREEAKDRSRLLWCFGLICLMPLAHIVGFAVLVPSVLPWLWRERKWFLARYRVWAPLFALGVLQLLYLAFYGPDTNPAFSSWDVRASMPLDEFTGVPHWLRRPLFWFFIDGDFLFWAVALVLPLAAAWLWGRGRPRSAGAERFAAFLRQWRWFLGVGLGVFVFVNVYRYSFDWGDSNKFVLFLNLGLTGLLVVGAAQWVDRPRTRWLSLTMWWFLFGLSVASPAYAFYEDVIASPDGKILLFHRSGRAAALWLRQNTDPDDVVLTAANNIIHFVTPLAARPTLAGIYGSSNPYRQDERRVQIRRIYQDWDLRPLHELGVRYVCVSRAERRRYRLHPKWRELMEKGTAVVYNYGGPQDFESVFIFDAEALSKLSAAETN